MTRKMSPERHATYISRRQIDRERTMQRRISRAVAAQYKQGGVL